MSYRVVIAGPVAPAEFEDLGVVTQSGPETVIVGDDLRPILERILALDLVFLGLRAD